jgi:hypothetical protein
MGSGGSELAALAKMAGKALIAAVSVGPKARENSVWTEFTGVMELVFCLSK